jgi:hypothetical protein
VPGAGAFVSRNIAPDPWDGCSIAGNFGSYDNTTAVVVPGCGNRSF